MAFLRILHSPGNQEPPPRDPLTGAAILSSQSTDTKNLFYLQSITALKKSPPPTHTHTHTHTHAHIYKHTYTLYFQSEPVIFWSLNVLKNRKLSHQPKEMNFQTLSLKMVSLITSPLDHSGFSSLIPQLQGMNKGSMRENSLNGLCRTNGFPSAL